MCITSTPDKTNSQLEAPILAAWRCPIIFADIDISTLLDTVTDTSSDPASLIDLWSVIHHTPQDDAIDIIVDNTGTVTTIPEPKSLLLFVLAAIIIVYRRAQ
jgi:hypothetical protein